MEEAGAGDFPEDSARIVRQTLGQRGAGLTVKLAFRIEKVGAIENAPHHVPLGEADRVVPDRVEHAAIDLSLCLGMSGTGWSMPELLRSRCGSGPPRKLLGRGVAQRVVQPDRPQPPIPFGVRHPHLLRPAGRKLRHPLDVL